jgi:hypothetical protein
MADQFLQDLKSLLGDELSAAVLYGRAAEDVAADGGDVNVLVVMKRVELASLARLDAAVRRARKRNVLPVFWSEEELRGSADVFPVEFLDILKRRKVLYGPDPFEGLSVDTRNLRHQVEFEFRSKLLRLRAEWPEARGSTARLAELLGRAAASFRALFPHARAVAPEKVREEWGAPIEKALKLRTKGSKPGRAELEALYADLHDAVAKIAAAV